MSVMSTPFELKVVIRCRDLARSREFYASVLGMRVDEEWNEEQGRGCIFRIGGGSLEIYEMTERDPRWQPAFAQPVSSDKIDLQLRTGDLDSSIATLEGRWAFDGPETLPWGQRWIKLRDPDGVLVAIYEVDTGD